MILTLVEPQAKVADVFLMLDESQTDIDKSTDRREFMVTVDGVAHWAGMAVNETKVILGHFVNQSRVEILKDKIIVKNINDFARFVNSRRKKS
jgi:CRP-like cAMP-binding protein